MSDASDASREITYPPETVESELHQIARDHYALLLRSGRTPSVAVGGRFEGVAYFPVVIEGCEFSLTREGLLGRQECGSRGHASVHLPWPTPRSNMGPSPSMAAARTEAATTHEGSQPDGI